MQLGNAHTPLLCTPRMAGAAARCTDRPNVTCVYTHTIADWPNLFIKYDLRHWMANFFLMAHSKELVLFKYFCTPISDAIFQMLPGERERVTAHLRALGMTDERIRHVPRRYWRRYCRYTIPAPEVLCRRLQSVYAFFRELADPGAPYPRPFFNAKHASIFKNSMWYIKRGYLSDPPAMDMYVEAKTLATGLVVYRCLRSTSPLEGYHLHLRQTLAAGAVTSSPRWQECVTNTFDFRWCVAALLRARLLPAWIRPFNLEVYDIIYDLGEKVHGNGEQVLPGHPHTVQQQPLALRHGFHFALEHQKKQLRQQQLQQHTAAASQRGLGAAGGNAGIATAEESQTIRARKSSASVQWVTQRLAMPHLRAQRSFGAVQKVLSSSISADSFFHDPAALQYYAVCAGVLMPAASAIHFARDVARDAAAWQVLHTRYQQLQRRLRDASIEQIPPMVGRNAVIAVAMRVSEPQPMPVSAAFVSGHGLAPVHLQPEVRSTPAADGGVQVQRKRKAEAQQRYAASQRQRFDALSEAEQAAIRAHRSAAKAKQRANNKLQASAGALP
ncbi:hypothetical protein JKP88DRAFT_245150 [Tribonema minus]|uniref:Uncharacterized protein n=2 Tax=Tribonema minus TaxID=303371 RepID=A0A835YZ85_9STRA|nr:hypothetical protein JKP88DRAFT_245150 [Tribonema minus]